MSTASDRNCLGVRREMRWLDVVEIVDGGVNGENYLRSYLEM